MQLKEQGQEIPEEFYTTKWVRFYFDQRVKPLLKHVLSNGSVGTDGQPAGSVEETKNTSRTATADPVYPQPTQDMIVKITS